jgi:hypothetical protein
VEKEVKRKIQKAKIKMEMEQERSDDKNNKKFAAYIKGTFSRKSFEIIPLNDSLGPN